MTSQSLFTHIGTNLKNTEQGKLFGKLCFKINGKAFVCFFQEEMVFKLDVDHHSNALSLDGSQLFDPSGKGRSMKEWVQVPHAHQEQWSEYAQQAMDYVMRLNK